MHGFTAMYRVAPDWGTMARIRCSGSKLFYFFFAGLLKIIEALATQELHVLLGHVGGLLGQLLPVGAKGTIGRGERRGRPIGGQGFDESVQLLGRQVLDFCTEVRGVRLNSVVAVVRP